LIMKEQMLSPTEGLSWSLANY